MKTKIVTRKRSRGECYTMQISICRIDETDVKGNKRKPCMVEISEEVYMQERRWRRKPVEPGHSREHEKSDREG